MSQAEQGKDKKKSSWMVTGLILTSFLLISALICMIHCIRHSEHTAMPSPMTTARIKDSPAYELIKAATTPEDTPKLPTLPDTLVQNAISEIESSPAIYEALSKLNALTELNNTWFQGVADLEGQRAVCSLLCCLCHPSEDVQIYVLRALARLKQKESLPFILQYARGMAVYVAGSENATIHGIIHREIARTMSAITGMEITLNGQDPEGLKKAISKCTTWLEQH